MSGCFLWLWGDVEEGDDGGFRLSGRCEWRGIRLIAILETSGIHSLRELRKQVARRKNRSLLLGL